MIHFIEIDVSNPKFQNKNKDWARPMCPNQHLNCKVYGHGHVPRFFVGVNKVVFLKRWRCILCKIIILIRPKSHGKRFQTSVDQLILILKTRLTEYRWPYGFPRQRGGHWLKKLTKLIVPSTENLTNLNGLEHIPTKNSFFGFT